MAIGPGIYLNKYKDYSAQELEKTLESLQEYLVSDELKKARQEEVNRGIDDNNCVENVRTEINVIKDLLNGIKKEETNTEGNEKSELTNIVKLYKENGISSNLIKMLHNFSDSIIGRDKQDPFWKVTAKNILEIIVVTNLIVNDSCSKSELEALIKDTNSIKTMVKENGENLSIPELKGIMLSKSIIDNEKSFEDVMEIIRKALLQKNTVIENINEQKEQVKDNNNLKEYLLEVDNSSIFKFYFPEDLGEYNKKSDYVFELKKGDIQKIRVMISKCKSEEDLESEAKKWIEKNKIDAKMEDVSYRKERINNIPIEVYELRTIEKKNIKIYKIGYVNGYRVTISGWKVKGKEEIINTALEKIKCEKKNNKRYPGNDFIELKDLLYEIEEIDMWIPKEHGALAYLLDKLYEKEDYEEKYLKMVSLAKEKKGQDLALMISCEIVDICKNDKNFTDEDIKNLEEMLIRQKRNYEDKVLNGFGIVPDKYIPDWFFELFHGYIKLDQLKMENAIVEHCKEQCNMSYEQAKNVFNKIRSQYDIVNEFYFYVINKKFKTFYPRTVQGISAKQLYETICKTPLDAYLYMVYLREEPEKALKEFNEKAIKGKETRDDKAPIIIDCPACKNSFEFKCNVPDTEKTFYCKCPNCSMELKRENSNYIEKTKSDTKNNEMEEFVKLYSQALESKAGIICEILKQNNYIEDYETLINIKSDLNKIENVDKLYSIVSRLENERYSEGISEKEALCKAIDFNDLPLIPHIYRLELMKYQDKSIEETIIASLKTLLNKAKTINNEELVSKIEYAILNVNKDVNSLNKFFKYPTNKWLSKSSLEMFNVNEWLEFITKSEHEYSLLLQKREDVNNPPYNNSELMNNIKRILAVEKKETVNKNDTKNSDMVEFLKLYSQALEKKVEKICEVLKRNNSCNGDYERLINIKSELNKSESVETLVAMLNYRWLYDYDFGQSEENKAWSNVLDFNEIPVYPHYCRLKLMEYQDKSIEETLISSLNILKNNARVMNNEKLVEKIEEIILNINDVDYLIRFKKMEDWLKHTRFEEFENGTIRYSEFLWNIFKETDTLIQKIKDNNNPPYNDSELMNNIKRIIEAEESEEKLNFVDNDNECVLKSTKMDITIKTKDTELIEYAKKLYEEYENNLMSIAKYMLSEEFSNYTEEEIIDKLGKPSVRIVSKNSADFSYEENLLEENYIISFEVTNVYEEYDCLTIDG